MELCGAGGGGFMVVITREPNAVAVVNKVLATELTSGGMMSVHAVQVCHEGMTLRTQA
jgi:galactokinase/mevalonate kinase-like predicted kinase